MVKKSPANPGVLAMLLTIKYADGLPLYRLEKVLNRHDVEVPRQTLALGDSVCGTVSSAAEPAARAVVVKYCYPLR